MDVHDLVDHEGKRLLDLPVVLPQSQLMGVSMLRQSSSTQEMQDLEDQLEFARSTYDRLHVWCAVEICADAERRPGRRSRPRQLNVWLRPAYFFVSLSRQCHIVAVSVRSCHG